MKIIAVSDVHLGWERSNPVFRDFLEWVEISGADCFILIGDIIEMWRRDIVASFIENIEIMKRFKKISDGMKLVLIAGNHDWHLIKTTENKSIVYKYPFIWIEEYRVGRYRFLHGHQFDPKTRSDKTNEAMCHTDDDQGTKMSDFWDKYGGKVPFGAIAPSTKLPQFPLFNRANMDLLEYVNRPGVPSRHPQLLYEIERNKKIHQKPGEFIISGHTHVPYVDMKNRQANTGSWTEGASDFLVIEDERVELKKWL